MSNPTLFKLTKPTGGMRHTWFQIITRFLLCFAEDDRPCLDGLCTYTPPTSLFTVPANEDLILTLTWSYLTKDTHQKSKSTHSGLSFTPLNVDSSFACSFTSVQGSIHPVSHQYNATHFCTICYAILKLYIAILLHVLCISILTMCHFKWMVAIWHQIATHRFFFHENW